MKPPILHLHASGTNRDAEAARACELAGGAPEIVHLPMAMHWAQVRGWHWTYRSI